MQAYLCLSVWLCVCARLCELSGSQEQQPGPEGSGAVLWETPTPDLYSISLCFSGWHKRKTHSDLIGCDWSCSAFLRPSGTLIFVDRGKAGNTEGGGRGGFHGLKMENITRLPATGVDIYVAEVIISQPVREFSFSPSFCWSCSPLPSIQRMCRRDKGRPFVIKTPD